LPVFPVCYDANFFKKYCLFGINLLSQNIHLFSKTRNRCSSTHQPTLIPSLREGGSISGKPDEERSLEKFLEGAGAVESASPSYSFQDITSATCLDDPTVARYSLSGSAPMLTEAILLAERMHAALVELSDGSSVFTGCAMSLECP
jgi:hypothetical protein